MTKLPDPPDDVPEIEILSSHAEKYEGTEAIPLKPGEEKVPSPAEAAPPALSEAEEWKRKHDEARDRLLWTAAELENYKKRVAREREEDHRHSQALVLREVLPVVDNLERALAALKGHEEEATSAFAALKQGVEMVLKQFLAVLEKHRVTRIPAVGQRFDPRVHEVMLQAESDEHPDETVLEELEGGYMIEDRVLRPARVKVSKRPPA